MESNGSVAAPIHPIRLILSTLGPVLLLALSYKLDLKIERKIIVGLIRSSIQLLFLGYLLLNILFSLNSLPLVLFYLFIMISIAALEATGRQQRTYDGHYKDSYISCGLGGGLVGLYGSLVIFHPTPWWTPQVMIPTCGMIIGNSVSGPAVAVERLLSEVTEKSYELETRLSFGSTYYESILPIVRTAMQAALLPTLNQLAIMGLVSIPGMMTGQLLGGTAPLIAAEYQMAILYLIVTTSALSIVISMILAIKNAIFELTLHQLTSNKIIKTKKTEIDVKLYNLGKSFVEFLIDLPNQIRQRFQRTDQPSSSTSSNQYNPLSPTDLESGLDDSKHPMNSNNDKGEIELNSFATLPTTGLATYEIIENDENLLSPELQSSDNILLTLKNLNVKSGESTLFPEHEGLNVSIYCGEIISIEGRSGLGKTRLLRALSALDIPLQGYAVYRNKMVNTTIQRVADVKYQEEIRQHHYQLWQVPDWRARVIYIPQALPPLEGNPKDLLVECLNYRSRQSAFQSAEICQELLTNLDSLLTNFETIFSLPSTILSTKKWNTLSGGERQRAAIICGLLLALAVDYHLKNNYLRRIGRAIPADPSLSAQERPSVLVLLDEPTAACDPETTKIMEQVFKESQLTFLLITHNEQQAQRIANRRILLKS